MLPSLLLALACNVPPAPEDVDGLAHWFWQHYDHEDQSIFADGLANLHAAVGGDTIDGTTDGGITGLSLEELEMVGRGDLDPAEVYGVYMSNLVSCPLSTIEELTWAADQDELHPGTYASYERVFTSDLEAYTSRETDTLTWTSTYHIDDSGLNYVAVLDGSLRYLDDLGGDADPSGPVLISRGVLTEDAPFDEAGEKGIFQDYQLEVYYERAPGEVVHMYVIWREMVYTLSPRWDFGDEVVQVFVLNGLEDWDDDADDYCAEE